MARIVFSPHQPAGRCSGRATPGATALMKVIVEERRDGARNWGIYNCRNVAGRQVRSTHGEGRALDIGFSGSRNPAGTRLVNALLDTGRGLGIQAIIWDRTVWSARTPRGTRYLGVSPHFDHIHIELSWSAANGLTVARVRSVLGGTAPTPPRPPASGRPSAARLVEAQRAGRSGRWVHPAAVRSLQARLTVKGHPGLVDGKYGAGTTGRVLAYQRRFSSLANDGIAGQRTVNHLWS